ncbi:hypothetical protein NUW54_g8021 [Trametes sanguinea]|uniref:Uncharacterized protein n=1 Tax=Trametes sanguinea TaxID=158606 RepID=A0ACC1PG84_9APHY|nr:hypothetical protein NUW54_g8021 [Trametes sanguinea]
MTLQEPTIFIVCTPETDADEDVTSVSERDQLRAELRQAFNSSLGKVYAAKSARQMLTRNDSQDNRSSRSTHALLR